jgi:hypothetical protein
VAAGASGRRATAVSLPRAPYLRHAFLDGVAQSSGREIDADARGSSPYQPTLTIIEAARALYARHSVKVISRQPAPETSA